MGRLLCGLAALWILTLYTVHPPWRARPRVMGVFLAGLLLIFLVLVLRDPWFGVCSAVGYVYAFRIIGWPAELWFIAGAGVVAGTAQANGIDLGTPGGLAAWAAVGWRSTWRRCAAWPGSCRPWRATSASGRRHWLKPATPTSGWLRRWPRTPLCTSSC